MEKPNWKPIKIKLGNIIDWDRNPKASTKKTSERLNDSLDTLGDFQTLAVSPFIDGGVMVHNYDGHSRRNSWMQGKGADFEVHALQSDRMLTEKEREKLAIVGHVATGSIDWDIASGWDFEDLTEWGLDEEQKATWDNDANNLKELLLSEEPESQDAEPQIDRAEELQEIWQVKKGDLWQIGSHRLVCGDCTDAAVAERVMGGNLVDLVVTDPPYSVDYAKKNEALNSIARSNRITTEIKNDTLTTEETAETIWKPAFRNAFALARNGAVIYSFSPQGGDQMTMMITIRAEWNKRLHQLIWRKNAPTFSMGRLDYQYQHEPICYTWKGTNHGFYGSGGRSVIDFDRPSSSKLHPTMKPVGLIEILVRNSSKVGEFVFEPFAGSGTTLIACENLGRRGRAIELSEKYCAVILQRMTDAFKGIKIERIE